ncbi:hypothetical protein SAMN05428981_11323 [Bacillus sp. OV194]|nr:hypothetical protein SAMN05428981_11323 [Bacillus sp. OV194]
MAKQGCIVGIEILKVLDLMASSINPKDFDAYGILPYTPPKAL